MTLRGKIVALVLGLTVAILAGLGLFLAGSWPGWSREAVERDLSTRLDALADSVEVKKDGRLEIEGEGSRWLDDPSHPYRVLAEDGFSVSSGDRDIPWPSASERVKRLRDRQGRPWSVVSRDLRLSGKHGRGPIRVILQVAGVDAPFGALEERFRHGLLIALAAALVLGVIGATVLAHLSLAPLRRLAAETDAIGASSLDRRIGTAGLDRELGRVASSFNGLLARLEQAMQRQRAFVSRASHALRTPTATILTRAEVALRRDRSAAEYRGALAEIATAARESAALVSHLLTLARLDERRTPLHLEPVFAHDVVADLMRLLRPRADEAGLALEFDVPSDLSVEADRAALREMLEALLDNALRYTPRGGRVGVRASTGGAGAVTLTVWDTGPGIPRAEREQIFEPFRRGTAGEASGGAGSGLGLAIVRTIADAHRATVSLGDRDGGGLEVGIRMGPSIAPAIVNRRQARS